MAAECEHDWRVNRAVTDPFLRRRQAVCVNCWAITSLSDFESRQWPYWEEQDYWNNLDGIEGDRAPDLRRMRGEDAREAGRGAAQRLLHTDPLSKESVDLIADAVMDAFSPGHRAEVLREAADAVEPFDLAAAMAIRRMAENTP